MTSICRVWNYYLILSYQPYLILSNLILLRSVQDGRMIGTGGRWQPLQVSTTSPKVPEASSRKVGSRSSPKNCKLLKSGLAGYGIIRIISSYLINLIISIRLNLRCLRQVQGKLDPDPDQPKICKLLKNWLCIIILWKWYFIRTPSQQIKMRILIWTIKC